MKWILFLPIFWSTLPSLPLFSSGPPPLNPLNKRESQKAESRKKDQTQEEFFQKLIEDLAHRSWKKREQASNLLKENLKKAYPLLEKALLHSSPEVRWRVQEILEFPVEKVVFLLSKKIAPSGGYGYYQGQFDDFKPLGEAPFAGLLQILSDPRYLNKILDSPASNYKNYLYARRSQDGDFDQKIRYLAVLAVGDLKVLQAKEALIKIYQGSYNTNNLKDTAACSLAMIGEKTYLNQLIRSIEKTIQRSTSYYRVKHYERLAHLHRNLNQFDKTIEYYKKALSITRKEPTLYYNLACAYATAKKQKEAIETLKKAVQEGYKDYQWMLLDRDLDYIKKTPEFKKIVEELQKNSSHSRGASPPFSSQVPPSQIIYSLRKLLQKKGRNLSPIDVEKLKALLQRLSQGKVQRK